MKPLIGITSTVRVLEQFNWTYHMTHQYNINAITRAGGLPVVIPVGLDTASLREIYDRVDGLLIPGGSDINPARYNAEPHEKTSDIDDQRDETEFALVRWAVAEDRPVLGICRGNQVFNVALGGTLIQDVPSQVETDIKHNYTPHELDAARYVHDVILEPDSRVAAILGSTRMPVNSLHHQCIGDVAPGLKVTAHAPDGIIEGLEVSEKTFALSVQWHPEIMIEYDDIMPKLFTAFIEAVQAKMWDGQADARAASL